MLVLGIETSCDETGAAVVEDGRKIRSNVLLSQVEQHAKFGGVVPELAARSHLEGILHVTGAALREAGVSLKEIGLVAATCGPGLIGGLLVGLSFAKALALGSSKPFCGVNHLEAHIYANFLAHPDLAPPLLCLTVSGGHTDLVYMEDHGKYRILGRTRDDAAGEAFDKVARVLGLGYPGGPYLEKAARQGKPGSPLIRTDSLAGTYDFSFSGLKTAVINRVHRYRQKNQELPVADLAATFQQQVVTILLERTFRAVDELGIKTVLLSGGVAANGELRKGFAREAAAREVRFFCPPLELCTDNAAMVAAAGYFHFQKSGPSPLDLPAFPRLSWKLQE
ncbi:MAG: tRNA (adenosine(37)-N6)-threonylcarbamoyltransferase complex transferase subunit TsaD [Firmicutes bacterium]|jgi:N6-L-threonylcarbamoyladenine synthase|nr:tRNA (adenosine(37)-N6)-threonylcarbamoyltransferase complex transferase subunit TsaD [Bacillota bacterium]